jgi:hypothetical protein
MQDGLDAFAAVAREYCAWAEGAPSSPADEARTARDLLARLVAAATALREPADEDHGEEPESGPTHDDWRRVLGRMAVLPVQYYRELPVDEALRDTADLAAAGSLGDLHDDLADVWRDLRRGLDALDDGRPGDAAWEWKFGFDSHWGEHATDALRVLHRVVTRDEASRP